jgi:hypothetical protein
MSRRLSRGKSKAKENAWDQAIADAQDLLLRVEQRAARIRIAIQAFKESKAAGEPYQTQSGSQELTQQHSV